MKKIIFITGEDMLDVDMPVVKEIHSNYEFTWIIILKGYGWFSEERLRHFLNENKINAKILHQNFKLKSPKTLFFHLKLLFLLRSLKADIYYDNYLGAPYLHFFSGFFIHKSRFVFAIHDVVLHYKMNNFMVRSFYYNFLKRKFKNFHVFSPNQFQVLKEAFPDKNILVAPLCLKDFGKPSSDFNNQDSKRRFLFFGILRENKGVDLLIKAVKELSKVNENFTVTISGKSDGDYWEKIKSQVENDDLFTLKIRSIANEEVPDLLTSADFMILPYRDITQSGVLLTSYNYELPVIASDLTGFNEYVSDGKNGFLFETGNINSLIKKIKIAIEMPDEQYLILKKNLTEFIDQNINAATISKKYIKYFDQLS